MPERRRFDFEILWNGTTTKLKADPKGWKEQSIGYSRADDFAVNTEFTTPISFVLDGRAKLVEINNTDGIHADAKLTIYRRDKNYQMREFYRYKLDFTTFQDDLDEVQLSGVEDSLYKAFEDYSEVDYEIDMPSTGTSKKILYYDGIVVEKENTIQVGFGDAIREEWQDDNTKDVHWLVGKRAVRSYDPDLSFVYPSGHPDAGVPFVTATFQCLNAKTAKIQLSIIGDIYLDGTDTYTGSSVFLCKHPYWNSVTDYELVSGSQVSPYNSRVEAGHTNTTIMFDSEVEFEVDLVQNYFYTIVFRNEGTGYSTSDNVSVKDGQDMFMSIKADAISDFDNGGTGTQMQVFTFDWLLSELVKKIYPDGQLSYSLVNNNYTDLVAFTNSLTYNDRPTIVTNLKDVLKALYVLNNCSINFNGSILEVKTVYSMYNDAIRASNPIEVSEISVSAHLDHVFNEIEVGTDTDEKTVENGLTKPFCQKNTFTFPNSKAKKKLDLVCPFMLDMYQIENYLTEVKNDPENVNDNKIMCFASKVTSGTNYELYRTGQTFNEFQGDQASAYNLPYSCRRILDRHLRYVAVGSPKVIGAGSDYAELTFNKPFEPSFSNYFSPDSNILFENIETNNGVLFLQNINLHLINQGYNSYIYCQLWILDGTKQTIYGDDSFPIENEDQKMLLMYEGMVNTISSYSFVTNLYFTHHRIPKTYWDILTIGDLLYYKSGNVTTSYDSFYGGHRISESFYDIFQEGDIIQTGVSLDIEYYTISNKIDGFGVKIIQTTPELPQDTTIVQLNKTYTLTEKYLQGGVNPAIRTTPSLPDDSELELTFNVASANQGVTISNSELITLNNGASSYDIKLFGMTGSQGRYDRTFDCSLNLQIAESFEFVPSILNFQSSQIKDTQCISQLGYESAMVTEQEDVPLADIVPLFFPYTAKFKTDEQFESLLLEETDKYNYYEFIHKKTGKVYRGWINDITFAVGEPQSQEWTVQLKNI